MICRHLFFLSRSWKSESLIFGCPGPAGRHRGPPPPAHGARPAPGQAARWRWRDSDCTRARARSVPGRENPPAGRTNLASPRLPPGAKTWGSAGGGGACSHRRSWEPTFPGYLPDPVSPNTQFIFLSGAASFLFSAAFRSQGSSNSRQGLSRGRNSFETWLCTLVPRTGRMHDPVSGGQLREKHSLTPAGEDKLP